MATKFTAAQLRGLKAEHEKEIRDSAINRVYQVVYGNIMTNAKKGDMKYSIDLIGGEHAPGTYYKVDEDFVADCTSKIQEEFTDCLVEAEMEEVHHNNRPYKKAHTKYTIIVDWSEREPAEKKEDISELEILRAKIAELEAENARLKVAQPVGAIAADLLDIFANFGKIN
jgi:hypothetical protein